MFVLFIETAKMALRSIVFCFEILFSFGFWRSNQDAPAAGGRRFGVVSAGRRGGRRRGRGANTPAPFSFFLGGGGEVIFLFYRTTFDFKVLRWRRRRLRSADKRPLPIPFRSIGEPFGAGNYFPKKQKQNKTQKQKKNETRRPNEPMTDDETNPDRGRNIDNNKKGLKDKRKKRNETRRPNEPMADDEMESNSIPYDRR